jgi:hypothetical protein
LVEEYFGQGFILHSSSPLVALFQSRQEYIWGSFFPSLFYAST